MKKEEINKVVVISGASSGIGLATAEFLTTKGYKVYGLSRRKVQSAFVSLQCDVTNIEDIEKAHDFILSHEGKINYLINNAGMGISGPLQEVDQNDLNHIIDVNIKGVVNTTNVFLDDIRKTKGRIVNIGSVAGDLVIPFQGMYSATKAAVEMISKSYSMELKPSKVQVICVLPGDTKTGFTANRVKNNSSDSLYQNRNQKSVKKMEHDEQKGVSAQKVSKVILKAMISHNPSTKMVVGASYRFLTLLASILPNRLVDFILYKMYAK